MKSIIIIGAGIAGLSAGVYGQANGFRTRIFEQHTVPGGLCTAWKRDGYTLDGCIHWLVGSGPSNDFYQIWQDLGAIQGKHYIDPEEFTRIHHQGKTLILYTNIDRLEAHLIELSPKDAKRSQEFCNALRKLSKLKFNANKPQELMSPWERLKAGAHMLPYLPLMGKYLNTTLRQFAQGYQDPFLREALARVSDLPDFSSLFVMLTLAWMHNKTAGYPIGGSLPFAQGIEKRYRELGGEIHYGQPVARILTENGKAVGVRLQDGSEHRADYVISAADLHATQYKMLEGKYLTPEIEGYFKDLPVFKPMILVALGVNRDFSQVPPQQLFELDTPLEIAGQARNVLHFKHFAKDPTLAPEGKTVAEVTFQCEYSYWERFSRDSEAYHQEKSAIAHAVIERLETFFPGIRSQVEVVDVATPLTFERYTGNWQGSFQGWHLTGKTLRMTMKKTLPTLANFYQIGQWVHPGGGLPPAALSGREALQLICHTEKQPFKAPSKA